VSKPLVLGAGSFVGRAIVSALGEVDASTRTGRLACDVRNAQQVEELVRVLRPSSLINCTGVMDGADPRPFYETHLLGTLNLLQAQRQHIPDSPLILLGTAAEYGPAPPPTSEEYPPQPQSFYGASKLAQTQLALVAQSQWNLPIYVLRLFNVIGPGLPAHYFLGSLARRFRGQPPGTIFPLHQPETTRDFVDVRDVAQVVALILQGKGTPGVTNVCSGVETTLGEAGGYLAQLAGQIVEFGQQTSAARVNVSRSGGDPARLRSWGWQPSFTWQQSVRDLWESLCLSTPATP
jgi:GDP-4-dehydro-6-deoxy-D-mannose reductase